MKILSLNTAQLVNNYEIFTFSQRPDTSIIDTDVFASKNDNEISYGNSVNLVLWRRLQRLSFILTIKQK
jgi:hypothetical protein